jgi:30S ribosomal protein S31
MGKGDKKTRRGKIASGSFGKTRPHKKKRAVVNNADGGKEKSAAKAKK